MGKIKTKECQHSFKLEKIDTETSISTSATPFYKKVGYAICEKCGLIIKQDLWHLRVNKMEDYLKTHKEESKNVHFL